jgi:SAM-dependent methyltransferase
VERDYELRTLAAEDTHWWYRGRMRVVRDAVRRSTAPGDRPRVLDIGCGGGATLAELARVADTTGVEPSEVSRAKAAAREVGPVIDAGVYDLPFDDGAFDLALLLDVLEHLDDEVGALTSIARVVVPGGALVVTVPAHPRLWSRHDEINHHRRRYTRQGLADVALRGGWEPVRVTHFMSVVLPLAAAARRLTDGDGMDIPSAPVNRLLRGTIEAEAALIRRGTMLPAGLSLLAELRRR